MATFKTPGRSVSLERKRKKGDESPESVSDTTISIMFEKIMSRLDNVEKKQTETLDRLDAINSELRHMDKRIDKNEAEIVEIKDNIEAVRKDIDEVKEEVKAKPGPPCLHDDKVKELMDLQHGLIAQHREIKKDYQNLREYSQRNNLVFYGIPEQRQEDCVQIIDQIIGKYMHLYRAFTHIDKAHRLGRTSNQFQNPRPIIVRFKSHSSKEQVYANRDKLQSSGIYVNLHLTEETQRDINILRNVLPIGKRIDQGCRLIGNQMRFQGKMYSVSNVHSSGLPVHKAHQKESDNALCFFGKLSPLSNFYRCDVIVNGYNYQCVEKYYQIKKAELGGDYETASRMRVSEDPVEIKRLSKDARKPNGDKIVLDQTDEESIMFQGLKAKFSNEKLKQILLETEGKCLGEASPFDRRFGIGLGLRDKNCLDKTKWKGDNVLGRLLERLRSELS